MARQPRFRACPLCEAICGLELQYEGEALVAIRGDAADPFSQGHVCPKGNAILDLEADPDRLRQPMRRRGSEWEQIGWEEALAEAGERLAAVQAVHGADAVAAYLGNPNVHHFGHIAYLPALLKSLRSRNIYSASSVDQWPHQLVDWLMYGHQFLLPIPDIDHTDYFLMLGANPVASNGSLMTAPGVARRLEALARRGQLVVVDPRRTETAGIANQHLFIRPGSDAWFLLALIQDMLALGPPRIAAYAGKLNGLDEALAAIQSAPTQDVQARTGIPRSDIRAVAEAFLAAPRAVAYGRMGVSTQAWGTLCQWLIQMVNLVSGNLDRVGGALPNEPALPLTGPGTSPGHRDRWRSRVSGRPEFAGELPVAVLAEEIRTPGPGQVRALLTCAGNPVLSTPDGRGLDAALASLDYMVSIDIYLNETTRHANLILPPASPLTQPHYDAHFNAFAVRRVARLSLPLRERKEDERADWEIINALGAAHAGAAGKAWQALPPPLALLDLGLKRGGSGLDVAQLAAAPHGLDLGPLRPSLLSRLETASGCIECAPALVLAELASLQARPADGQALRLIGQRHVRSNNSWMHNAPRLVKGPTRHELRMHPDDLAKRGIASGSEVILASATGSVRVTVLGDAAVMPGVACLPHGFGHQRPGTRQRVAQALAGASYNDLSSPSDLDQASGNAALNGIPVTVTAA